MKVKHLIECLDKADPESNVEIRISNLESKELRYISTSHPSSQYQHVDGSWHHTPPSGSEYHTINPNTILLTNWFMTSSYE